MKHEKKDILLSPASLFRYIFLKYFSNIPGGGGHFKKLTPIFSLINPHDTFAVMRRYNRNQLNLINVLRFSNYLNILSRHLLASTRTNGNGHGDIDKTSLSKPREEDVLQSPFPPGSVRMSRLHCHQIVQVVGQANRCNSGIFIRCFVNPLNRGSSNSALTVHIIKWQTECDCHLPQIETSNKKGVGHPKTFQIIKILVLLPSSAEPNIWQKTTYQRDYVTPFNGEQNCNVIEKKREKISAIVYGNIFDGLGMSMWTKNYRRNYCIYIYIYIYIYIWWLLTKLC